MDAATFTPVRIAAGAVVLAALVRISTGRRALKAGRGAGGRVGRAGSVGRAVRLRRAVLVRLRAHRRGGGRAAAVRSGADHDDWARHRGGERPGLRGWAGIALAAAGLAWLTLPRVGRPDPHRQRADDRRRLFAGASYSLAGRRGDRTRSPPTRAASPGRCRSPWGSILPRGRRVGEGQPARVGPRGGRRARSPRGSATRSGTAR